MVSQSENSILCVSEEAGTPVSDYCHHGSSSERHAGRVHEHVPSLDGIDGTEPSSCPDWRLGKEGSRGRRHPLKHPTLTPFILVQHVCISRYQTLARAVIFYPAPS